MSYLGCGLISLPLCVFLSLHNIFKHNKVGFVILRQRYGVARVAVRLARGLRAAARRVYNLQYGSYEAENFS